jgi:hypothetical protein
MGASFVNVQVRAAGAAVRDAIVRAVTQSAASAGYAEAPDGAECDREVLIGERRGGWITVYDELAEMQDTEVIDAVTCAISEATGDVAVAVLVHDSDILQLRRFDGGRAVDVYDSAPGYWDGADEGPAGDAERWRDLLVSGSADDLEAAWSSTPVLAEELLAGLAPSFGWSSEATTGYRYALEASDVEGFRSLRFHRAREVSQEEPEGPPNLDLAAWSHEARTIVGSRHLVAFSVRNSGGEGVGWEIQLWGSALDRGLLEVELAVVGSVVEAERAPAIERLPGSMINTLHGSAVPVADDDDDGVVLRAEFPELPIAVGVAAPDPAGLTHRTLAALIEAQSERDIRVEVHTRARAAGRGILELAVVPDDDPEDGTVSHVMKVEIESAGWMPARGGDDVAARLALHGDKSLVAVVALGAQRHAIVPEVAAAFERWHAAIAPFVDGDYRVDAYPSKRDRSKTLPRERLAGNDWERWSAALDDVRWFNAVAGRAAPENDDWLDDEDLDDDDRESLRDDSGCGPEYGDGHGFTFAVEDTDDAVPLVGLWLDTTGLGGADVARVEAALVAIVDRLMSACDGLQAFVGRWDWTPLHHLYQTPYEAVVDAYGDMTTRAWSSRYVRAVAPTLWLGEDLWRRLDASRLQGVATIEGVGAAKRVRVRDLAALEAALAPVLPPSLR